MVEIKYVKGDIEYEIIKKIRERENVCILGPGGTGKTTLLKYIIKKFDKDYDIGVSSTTGVSALNLEGVTAHKLFGVGLAQDTKEHLFEFIKEKRRNKYKYLSKVDIIIIDEVSMLSKIFFEKLDYIMKKIRKCDEFFGGVQVIFSGDFLQLPPVRAPYVFTSDVWLQANAEGKLLVYQLNKCRRYANQDYFELLQRARIGKITSEDSKKLYGRFKAYKEECINGNFYDIVDGKKVIREIQPVRLFPYRRDVNSFNTTKLKELNSEPKIYVSKDKIKRKGRSGQYEDVYMSDSAKESLFRTILVDEKLSLKVGCQVMCTRNMTDNQYVVNGSVGIVQQLNANSVFVKFDGVQYPYELGYNKWDVKYEKLKLIREQIPLILSYAITIHKSQSQTLETCVIDIGDVFTKGQAYVALSRCRFFDKLYLKDYDPDSIEAHPDVLDYLGIED